MAPNGAFFEHGGHRLYYETYGEGDRLLVYLNALLMDAGINQGIAAALAERGDRVVLLDLLGHGRSDKPARASAYRMDLYVEEVIALLDELGARSAVIGGISLGANVSLLTAVRAPGRVRGLVLEMPVLERAAPSAALLFVPLLLALHYAHVPAGLVTQLFRRVPRLGLGPVNSLLNAASLDPDQMAAVLHGLLLGPVTPTIEQRGGVTAPSLVLAHRYDLIHPFSDAASLVHQMPNARLVPARAPFELRVLPRRLTAEVAAFLDEVWRPSPLGDIEEGTTDAGERPA